jgi:4-hydroxyphenylpyruvate dioxygenase
MTNYEKPKERPDGGEFYGFDHIVFWVGNARQAASYYTSRFGFEYLAYKGLETGSRQVATHVITNGKCVFAFCTPYHHDEKEMNDHIVKHGDGVKDVAFQVENATAIYEKAVKRGAKSVQKPTELKDENGTVIVASVQTYGDTIHTFVQRVDFKGVFLPGFKPHPLKEAFNTLLKTPDFNFVDHVVGNQPDNEMTPTADWYEKMLDWHRFWSVDDSIIHSDYSSLRSIVVTDFDERIKMPINEPAKGKKKSQIQEYVDYYAGAGVQHIALNTSDIITTITRLRERGVDFLEVPSTYYDNLRKAIPHLTIKIQEDIDTLQKLRILVDYDDKGYLLQLFTKPVEDRPTLFFEIIQRHNHQGFGAGNFKSLFKAIEDEQERRGNLTDENQMAPTC